MIKARAWRPLRLSLVFLILTAYGAAVLWLYRECSVLSTVAANADTTTATTCAPPTASSATVLILILIVVLLLWPDISEVTVLGVTLKRKVEEAKKDAAAAKEEVGTLSLLVQSLQVQISSMVVSTAAAASSANISQSFVLPDYPWNSRESARVQKSVEELQRELDERRQASGEPVGPSTGHYVEGSKYLDLLSNLRDDELSMRLIREWAQFDSMLAIQTFNRPRREDQLSDEELRKRHAQRGFVAEHREAIAGVRSLRNAVAHGKDVYRNDVIEGLQALALLTSLAGEWLGNHGVDN